MLSNCETCGDASGWVPLADLPYDRTRVALESLARSMVVELPGHELATPYVCMKCAAIGFVLGRVKVH